MFSRNRNQVIEVMEIEESRVTDALDRAEGGSGDSKEPPEIPFQLTRQIERVNAAVKEFGRCELSLQALQGRKLSRKRAPPGKNPAAERTAAAHRRVEVIRIHWADCFLAFHDELERYASEKDLLMAAVVGKSKRNAPWPTRADVQEFRDEAEWALAAASSVGSESGFCTVA